jgi:U4/U6.U5 tri-snRNP-associated protein 3
MSDLNRRNRRPDSKQMWDDSERRDQRNSRDHRDDRRDDRRRNYRSRSRDRPDRDRNGGRDRDRERDRDGGRGAARDYGRGNRDDRDRDGRHRGEISVALRLKPMTGTESCKDEGRSKPRSRSRDRERRRSRSPKLDMRDVPIRTVEDAKSRTSTPPTGPKSKANPEFGAARGLSREQDQAYDQMDMDGHDAERSQSRSAGIAIKSRDVIEEPETYDDDVEVVEEDDGLAAMQAMMGFGGFGTTKQKKVPGNDVSAVRKEKKTEYRQYMNRVGGFNRPLSPPRE